MPDAETAVAHALSGGGQSLDKSARAQMEPRLGHDFSQVRIHTDSAAAQSAEAVNAHAYNVGSDIVFGPGQYAPHSARGQRLLAHELSHVAQRLPADQIFRAVKTNGGEFDTTTYAPHGSGAAVGNRIGATIELHFDPGDLVEADNIGLTQTVKTFSSTRPGGPVNDPSFVGTRNKDLSLYWVEGDEGRAIDQGDSGDADTVPNTNPLYAVENTPGSVSATLTDVPANAGTHGHRKRKTDDTYEKGDAILNDAPSRGIAFVGQEWQQTFESTALVLDGPMANTYLGSIEWGWQCDAAGNVTAKPDPIRLVRAGAPTSDFMAAATKWNNATFTDPSTGTAYDTVDLPTTTLDSGAVAANDMGTTDLLTQIALVNSQLTGLAAGPDKTNKEFEKKVLEAELLKRSIKVTVKVHETEDWLGADNVYVSIAGFGKAHRTGEKKLNDGDSGDFLIPLSTVIYGVTPGLPFVIQIYDADWPDADDLMFEKSWTPPYAPITDTQSRDDGRYEATIQFDK